MNWKGSTVTLTDVSSHDIPGERLLGDMLAHVHLGGLVLSIPSFVLRLPEASFLVPGIQIDPMAPQVEAQ